MKRFLLYGHGGAYNHGAEAIVKTTIKLIREKYDNAYIILSSHFPEQDREFKIDADEILAPNMEFWQAEKSAILHDEKEAFAREMYSEAISAITPDTVLLSIGGDNFCYPNWHRLTVFQQEAVRKNSKSILWGCSVEPSAITPKMVSVLNSYTYVLTRESRTYHALKKCLDTKIHLLPDPAFLLKPEMLELPTGFKSGKLIGINLSPLILRRETFSGILIENVRNLIDYILSETDMKIALIPHVTASVDNDYEALSKLWQWIPEKYHSRVWVVDALHSAAEYKSVISQCVFLVCSRTHASIAAYSSGIPSLVIGYSIKSIGIAEDVGLKKFVLDVSEIESPDIIKGLCKKYLVDIDDIKNTLNTRVVRYIEQTKHYMRYI